MKYINWGRTGLEVSVAGLGCGGSPRLGLGRGKTQAQAVALVREAIALGVNLIDTARVYGTEPAVGEAIRGMDRSKLVICTKHQLSPHMSAELYEPAAVIAGLEQSLRELGTDYVDVFYLHALTRRRYAHAFEVIVPALLKEKEKGKFRFLGATEAPAQEPEHQSLRLAIETGLIDCVMLGFQLFHQNARELLFPRARELGVGTAMMFVVRDIFANPPHLRAVIERLAAEGKVPAQLAGRDNPLDFLIHPGGAASNIDAAYRFAAHEPGADVILFGTGDPAHLRSNIESILAPPLPEPDLALIRAYFGGLVAEGLETPGRDI